MVKDSMARKGMVSLAGFGLLLVWLAAALYAHLLTADFGDKTFELFYARRLLEGAELYRDIWPISPPLIFWLYRIALLLDPAQGAGDMYSGFAALHWAGSALVLGCAALGALLLRAHPLARGRPLLVFGAAGLLVFILILRTNPHFYLDREHLFFALTLPFLLRFSPGLFCAPLPSWLRIAVSLAAGLGFCFKPQCVLLLLPVLAAQAWQARSLKAVFCLENLITGALGLLYLASVWLLHPDYFRVVMPMALATYDAVRDDTSSIYYLTNALTVLAFSFIMFAWRARSALRGDIAYLAALCPFYYLYALTNNNWAYTYYPLGSAALLLAGFVMAEFCLLARGAQGMHKWRMIAGALLCAGVFAFKACISVQYHWMIVSHPCRGAPCNSAAPLLGLVKEGETFGAISGEGTRWANLSRFSGAAWRTRYLVLWMMPKFQREGEAFAEAHGWILDEIARGYADDLNRHRPALVFVDDLTSTDMKGLLDLLVPRDDFRQAWAHYREAERIDLCGGAPRAGCMFQIYRRAD